MIQDVSDKEALEIAIVENVQRADLNPVEEALGYDQLIEEFSYTQQDLADVIGKSRSHVANTMRLLKLPAKVQHMLSDGQLTAGHARTLIGLENAESLAAKIAASGMSVRDAELLAAAPVSSAPTSSSRSKPAKDQDVISLEQSLSDRLGLAVSISHQGEKGGSVTIKYKTLEQLDAVCARLRD